MKNKKPKPRVMWANPSSLADIAFLCDASKNYVSDLSEPNDPAPIRVAVIPLDDVEGMVIKAAGAYWAGEKTGAIVTRGDAMRRALSAIGIPCAKRKASK